MDVTYIARNLNLIGFFIGRQTKFEPILLNKIVRFTLNVTIILSVSTFYAIFNILKKILFVTLFLDLWMFINKMYLVTIPECYVYDGDFYDKLNDIDKELNTDKRILKKQKFRVNQLITFWLTMFTISRSFVKLISNDLLVNVWYILNDSITHLNRLHIVANITTNAFLIKERTAMTYEHLINFKIMILLILHKKTTETEEIIMDNICKENLQRMIKILCKICDAIDKFNRRHRVEIFQQFTYIFCSILLHVFYNQFEAITFKKVISITFWNIFYLGTIISMLHTATVTTKIMSEIPKVVQDIVLEIIRCNNYTFQQHKVLLEELILFSELASSPGLKFSIYGIANFSYSILISFASNIVSYVVVLMLFK
ncbi:uncharacterized protein LOC108733945 [Agrilus planipennis]|uniref:Uncharacterized protein LOC108733945 n=1 Tax=Agrilus planipennis TaxID=224129 RepID=A0A1W4WK27_AGRPL|nr:uncharacterized protein LOC108733945 [Agrilus planipennis]